MFNLVHRAMPVCGLEWHWLWGNCQPEPLNLGVPVLCRHARLINVKPITAQEKFNFPRANAILARAQALLWVRDCFMFGKYKGFVSKARGCCMHVFSSIILYFIHAYSQWKSASNRYIININRYCLLPCRRIH
jgi:hypothetical protein